MSHTQVTRTTLGCDMCTGSLSWHGAVSRTSAERMAREKGWRKDKLGRNICPGHPKLKGARR